ncbi:hypothetical protein ACHAPI_009322 [Fusarium lateritium]
MFSSTASSAAECELDFGRACEVNLLEASEGDWDKFTDTSFFSEYSEYDIAPAASAEEAKKSVPANAGAGKIDTAMSSDVVSDGSATESTDSNTSSPEPATTKEATKPEAAQLEEATSTKSQEEVSRPSEAVKKYKGSCKARTPL